MPADIKVGDNRTTLQGIRDAKAATPAAQAAVQRGRATGETGTATKTGDATWTTIVWAHNLPYTPSRIIISPRTAAAGASAAVTAISATTFTITMAAAPANAAVVTFDYVAYA
jgi:hypothetical protein